MFLELRLNRMRKRDQHKLTGDNLCIFQNITDYISNSSLSIYEREEVLQQILDIMLEAQSEGKSMDLVLGSDRKLFCDSIIKEYDEAKRMTFKVANFIEQFIVYVGLWIIFDGIFSIRPYFRVSFLVSGILMFLVINPMQKKSKMRSTYDLDYAKSSYKTWGVIIALFFILNYAIKIASDKLGLSILSASVSFYSIRYILVISMMFIIVSEVYKVYCNKKKISMG